MTEDELRSKMFYFMDNYLKPTTTTGRPDDVFIGGKKKTVDALLSLYRDNQFDVDELIEVQIVKRAFYDAMANSHFLSNQQGRRIIEEAEQEIRVRRQLIRGEL